MSVPLKNPPSAVDSPAPADGAEGPLHRETVARLVREHNAALHAFLMMRVKDAQEALDVAQEAYVRMLQLERPDAISFLRAYLFKTAANIAIDRARSRNNRQRLAPAEHEEEPVDELSPDQRVMSAEDLEVFKQAVQELPPKCRRAFLLCRVDGLSDTRVATLLGLQPRMIRHYLTYAGAYCRLRIQGLSQEQANTAAR